MALKKFNQGHNAEEKESQGSNQSVPTLPRLNAQAFPSPDGL